MSDSRSTRTNEGVADECRRLAELLDLDTVGVSTPVGGRRRSVFWSIPEAPAVPGDLDEIIVGKGRDWVVATLDDGSVVYGRLTPRSSPRAESVLRAIAPSLIQTLARPSVHLDVDDTEIAPDIPFDTGPVHAVLAGTRTVLENPESSVADLLITLRRDLGADEVFHLVERSGDVTITSSPPSDRLRRVPREIRAKVRSLAPSEALEEATARQLAVVIGATTPFVSGALCRHEDPREILLVGWRRDASVSPAAMELIAHIVGASRAALEARRRAVETLLVRDRNRWAYEIHDGVTQAVTTSVLELEALTHKIQRDPAEAIETLGVSKSEIRKALSELRGILFDLSKEHMLEVANDEPLAKYVHDVVRRWRLPARVTVKGDLHHVPKPLLGAGYVVIREALANAAKHADARNVTVYVSASREELVVEVGDSGRGFAVDRGPTLGHDRHFGLEMMRKRVAEVGGTLEVDSAPGRGTRVTARLPIPGESGGG